MQMNSVLLCIGQTSIWQTNQKQMARIKQNLRYLPSYSVDKAALADSRIARDADIYFDTFPSFKSLFEELWQFWNAMFFYVSLGIFLS